MTAAPIVATGPPRPWEGGVRGPSRFVVLTGSIGGGHVGPARELARRLVLAGHRADVIDVVAAAPAGVGRMMRALFRAQLSWAPGTWDRIFRFTDRDDAAAAGTGGLHHLVVPALRRVLAQEQVAAVVSTFPLASHAAARAIRDGGRKVPLITYLTDPAPHAAWIVDGTDRYLTGWEATADELRRRTAAPVGVVEALVRPEFRDGPVNMPAVHHRREETRGGLVLVCSGSWGVGDIAGTVADLLSDRDGPTPVVVCGRNDRLRRRLADRFRIPVLGWVSDMASLMRDCQAAVLNSGGLTLAEAEAVGLPVVHYRPLAGQGLANATFTERAGLARWARSVPELTAAVRTPPAGARMTVTGSDAVTEVLELAGLRPAVRSPR
jgi:UDP-N-acetylglucosamine:LPS N-acetylglucosamine transferase